MLGVEINRRYLMLSVLLVSAILLLALAFTGRNKVVNNAKDITAYVKDNDKLVVKDNGSTKTFTIPGIVQLSIAPSGDKIAFWSYEKNLSNPRSEAELLLGYLDYMQSPASLNILNIETGSIKKYKLNTVSTGCKWSEDSRYIFIPNMEGVIYAVDTEKAQLEYILEPDYNFFSGAFIKDDIYVVKFAQSGYYIEMRGIVSILKDSKLVNELKSVQDVKTMGTEMLALSNDNKLQILRPLDGKVLKSFDLPKEARYSFKVSPGGETIAVNVWLLDKSGKPKACFDDGYYGDHIRIYDKNFKLLARLKGEIQDIAFVHDKSFYFYKYAKVGQSIITRFFLYNTKSNKSRELGKFRAFDWLTEDNTEARIFRYPENTRKVKTSKLKSQL